MWINIGWIRNSKLGKHVYLIIKPKKSSLNIGPCAKLALQFCGTFEIHVRIGEVAYRLDLPPSFKTHDVFHVSLLKIYVQDSNHVIDWFVLQMEQEGEFQPEPLCMPYWRSLTLQNGSKEKVKVQWRQFGPEEATLEMDSSMRVVYHFLFVG